MSGHCPDPQGVLLAPVPALAVEHDDAPKRWGRRCLQTILQLVVAPTRCFRRAPEPVNHGRALGFLATLVLPVWGLLVIGLLTRVATHVLNETVPTRPSLAIHAVIEPGAAQAWSTWGLLMMPIALPVLYFILGLVAHIGIALTGGATRSIGGSMRTVGYILGPAMLVIGLLSMPLYFGAIGSTLYFSLVGGVGLWLWGAAGFALASTHRVWPLRGLLVAMVPAVVFVGLVGTQAALVLPDLPFVASVPLPYVIP